MATSGLQEMGRNSERPLAEIRAQAMAQVPLGKMSQPEEIAELVYFLVGGFQNSITGQALDINNGAVMV